MTMTMAATLATTTTRTRGEDEDEDDAGKDEEAEADAGADAEAEAAQKLYRRHQGFACALGASSNPKSTTQSVACGQPLQQYIIMFNSLRGPYGEPYLVVVRLSCVCV